MVTWIRQTASSQVIYSEVQTDRYTPSSFIKKIELQIAPMGTIPSAFPSRMSHNPIVALGMCK